MPQVDQFESVFRSAVKAVFTYRSVQINSVLLITDLDPESAQVFQQQIADFLCYPVSTKRERQFFVICGNEFETVEELLAILPQYEVDMLCTYRNLHSRTWQYPHSLGEHLDVLLQQSQIPVMVLPHPGTDHKADHALQDTTDVMVVTDLTAVNDPLINQAASLTQPDGNLYLTHVEDRNIFDRYMEAISKIDVINTDIARERLKEQLLKEPEDYFRSCASGLSVHYPQMQVSSLVTLGDLVDEYRHYIESRSLDLLVLSAKDERQHAMHSIAYPLTVELRHIPLLLL